jgi:hypothetical protein
VFGSDSGLDPDSTGLRIWLQEGKSDSQKERKKIFHNLKSWTFSLGKWRFLFSLENPSWRPKKT